MVPFALSESILSSFISDSGGVSRLLKLASFTFSRLNRVILSLVKLFLPFPTEDAMFD